MKICRIVYEMPPPWDGLAPHPYEITHAQALQGHDITVFCGIWPKSGPSAELKNVKYKYILREPFPATISITSSVLLFFSYLFWRRKNKPDILHCHGHFAIWIYAYRALLKKYLPWTEELSIPLVVHFHNTAKGRWETFKDQDKYITPHSKYIQWPLSVFSDKQATIAATSCIFVSQTTKEEAIKYYGVDPRICFVVETGVNAELFVATNNIEREKSRKELDIDAYDKVILNLGLMVERKNILALIQALKYLPSTYKLVLVGKWDSAYQTVALKEISTNDLQDRVLKMGSTPYPMTPIAYQIADVFVLPSSWEGLPKAVMEALSCGVPSLVSGFKLQQELAGLFYLDNQEPQHIAAKIQEIVEAKPRVDVQTVHLKYSWNERVKEIDKVYEFSKKITV